MARAELTVNDLRNLENKIKDKSAEIGIVGLGYVGLPLALAFVEAGFSVTGMDSDKTRINKISRGVSYLLDIESPRLKKTVASGKLKATVSPSAMRRVDIIIICVPTPLTRTKEPDMTYIVSATNEIARYLRLGHLIILESTTYPGTTREVVLPLLELTGLKVGVDYFLTFSPERIDPGSRNFTIRNTPKVVGGMEPKSTKFAAMLYRHVSDKVIEVSSPEVAEMDKVFENVFRSVNIALVNDLAKLCEKMNVNVWEVIKAASSKPFGYMPFYPGPGVGGHCIPLDPYYLASKAREYFFHTRFIELAAEINETMPEYIVQRICGVLNDSNRSVKGAKILCLGVAYKKDIEDVRESPALRVIELLVERKARVSYNDPYIAEIKENGVRMKSIKFDKKTLGTYDCVVILTDHTCYDLNVIAKASKLVFDTRGCTVGLKANNVIRLGE
ncbi:MAG: nucleotide sugar dehydrogenase [Dehalococcoidia bacterium]|nr:nucleotide sugar dehydrogenase [Dehalococcoidia bacterium]